MRIAETCVRRPVLAAVLSLVLILLGGLSYLQLSVREYPRIDEPVVTVETRYVGASAEIIESQVTKPLEDSIAGIEGIDVLSSVSRTEVSQITVRFKLFRQADDAAADVRDRVSRARQRLPQDADDSIIAKVEADASPIIWLSFTSDRESILQVSDYVNRIVKPQLQVLPGVADIRIFGERRYAMRIFIDRDRLASFRLTPHDIEEALRQQNVEIPAGRIESRQREFSVVSSTELTTPEEFGQVVVRSVNGMNVRIRDVADVFVAPQSERTIARFNGEPTVSPGIIRQATANPLDVSRALQAQLPSIRSGLPAGMQVKVSSDQTVFIEAAMQAVTRTIVESLILVSLVVFVFLRSWRAATIALVAIPVSLVGSFLLMYVFGFSINTLTLLALVLSIGLVVDDAIVVIENISRHLQAGLRPIEAAIQGMKEIGFAVVAMTITLAVVFVPLAFTPGRTGRLFVEFALALSGAVLVSGFVALTLSPMMSSRLLRGRLRDASSKTAYGTHPHGFLAKRYGVSLRWLLDTRREGIRIGRWRGEAARLGSTNRWAALLVVVALAASGFWLGGELRRELTPVEDRGSVLVFFSGPEGASIGFTSQYGAEIEDIAAELPEIDGVFVVNGFPTVNRGVAFLRTSPWEERAAHARDIARDLTPRLAAIPGVTAFPVVPAALGGAQGVRPVNFVVTSGESYGDMQRVVAAMMIDLSKNPGLQSVDSDLRLNRPELRVVVDREKVADAGLQVATVGRTLETMLSGRNVTRFRKDGEQYDVMVQLRAEERNAPADISKIFVRGRDGVMISLSSLVRVEEVNAPRDLNHFGQRRSVAITANLAPGYSLGEALDFVRSTYATHARPGYASALNGASREFNAAGHTFSVVLVLALVFVYLVLAAQFESFRDPLLILLTVPLAVVGALLALKLDSNGSLNVYSQIGLVTLTGLITKNGILIVDFANRLQAQGRDQREAVIEASMLRLRPILMTTTATIAGALPLVFAEGAGAEARHQIGLVIAGGMSLGTLLTLYVIPAAYTLAGRRRELGSVEASGSLVASGAKGE
jgi:multidrug efflux pump